MDTAITAFVRPHRNGARERRVRLYRRRAESLASRAPAGRRPNLPAGARASAQPRHFTPSRAGRTLKKIAEVIGRHLNIPVVLEVTRRGGGHFGWFAMLRPWTPLARASGPGHCSAGSPHSLRSSPISIIRPISLTRQGTINQHRPVAGLQAPSEQTRWGGACSSFATAAPVALGVRGSLWGGLLAESQSRQARISARTERLVFPVLSMYLACLSSV